MKILEDIMVLIMLLIASNIIHKKVPKISLPLIHVLIGVLIWLALGTELHFESDFFMLLFIAPILYMDGEHISKRELWKLKMPVVLMAIGLVFFTILFVGLGIHWLIPQIPLAACFALAAVLSPTDAVAVKAVSNRVQLPKDIITIVEGESLINDASGLVAFNFAIAAVLTGVFSIEKATLSFFYIAFGGILVGFLVICFISFITQEIKHMGVEEAPVFTLLQILTPFIIYFFAEELGFSGVLAVVTAGIVHSLHPYSRVSAKDASIKYISDGAWTTLLFTLNGLIFLILGIKLPDALQNTAASDHINNITLLGYVVAISIVLVIIRFIWALIFVGKRHGNRLYAAVLIALSGARGTITLAACFSIPMFLNDGVTPFPERDLLLFLSSGVIIVMLLITNIILPLVAPKPAQEDSDTIKIANKKVLQAAIDLLKHELNERNKIAAYTLISHYEELLMEYDSKEKHAKSKHSTQSAILLLGLAAEKEELVRLAKEGTYSPEVLDHIDHSNDFVRIRLSKNKLFASLRYSLNALVRPKKYIDQEQLAQAKILTIEAAIKTIMQNITPTNEATAKKIIAHYTSTLDNFSQISLGGHGKEYVEIKRNLEVRAIQVQKITVKIMTESGEISHSTADILRKYIYFAELAIISGEITME